MFVLINPIGKSFIRVKNYLTLQFSQNYASYNADEHKAATNSEEYDCESGFAKYKGTIGTEADTTSYVCTDVSITQFVT